MLRRSFVDLWSSYDTPTHLDEPSKQVISISMMEQRVQNPTLKFNILGHADRVGLETVN